MRCDKHLTIAIFTFAFHYLFLPAAVIFSFVAGLTLSCYSFKATVYMLTGSLSVHKYEMPRALVVSKIEFVIGLVLSAIGGGMAALYQMYVTKQLEFRQPRLMFPYDPEDMATRYDNNVEMINQVTQNSFDELVLDTDNEEE